MSGSVVELLALEGEDAGRLFTLTRDEVEIARVNPSKAQPGAIVLMDPTVSLHQATIHTVRDEFFLEHCPAATNPTTLNGKPIIRQQFAPGDRIGMGRVMLEVRERDAGLLNLSTHDRELSNADTGPRATARVSDTAVRRAVAMPTESRPLPADYGQLTILTGNEGMSRTTFPIASTSLKLGRSSLCEVTIPEGGVSRLHAELVIEGTEIVIVHHSRTNATSVNGNPVVERMTLESGDHIQLADRVLLRFDRVGSSQSASQSDSQSGRAPSSSLWSAMEDEVLRNRQIEEEFGAFGSFLDIDVVGSSAMKARSTSPGRIVVSFERWRSWVQEILARCEGDLLNSNGDELMCFFEMPLQAVRAASALLDELDDFNRGQNLLPQPFRLRTGIHTGFSLVDRVRGVAYSEVLDLAGHLQKHSEVNGLLISSVTLEHLPDDLPFEEGLFLQSSEIQTYRLTEPLAASG